MRVLIITPNYPNEISKLSGVFFRDQAVALAKNADLSVTVIAAIAISIKKFIKRRKFIQIESRTVRLNEVEEYSLIFPAIPKLKRLNYFISFIIGKRMYRKYKIKNGIPDILHAHSFHVGRLPLFIKKKDDVPFVITEHYSSINYDRLQKWQWKLGRKIFKNSNKNIAVSEHFAKLLESHFRQEFVYIPNVVDTEFFIPRNEKNSNNKVKTFLSVGFLNKNKNHSMLIEAFKIAFNGDENYLLNIAGDGTEKSKLESLIKEFRLEKQVSLLGELTREEVRDEMQKADYFVLPSKYETFGLVLIEAMSCGLPVIATRCGGPESIITNEKLGILCEINVEALIESIRIITKKFLFSSYIREHVVSYYSAKIIAKRLCSLYKNYVQK